MSLFFFALLLCIVLPFALWGDVFDLRAPGWMHAQEDDWLLACVGVALLIADVSLPIPSSIVAMALCWRLGPWWGGASVAIGMMLAFAVGYGIGRSVPEPRLRRWVGSALWDAMRARARGHAMWWIVFARPLPVLAEMSALLAGVWRLPFAAAFANAAVSSCAVAALYAGSAWFGRGQPSIVGMLAAMCLLPAALWLLHRWWLRWSLRHWSSAVD